jgi:hypothetical protein
MRVGARRRVVHDIPALGHVGCLPERAFEPVGRRGEHDLALVVECRRHDRRLERVLQISFVMRALVDQDEMIFSAARRATRDVDRPKVDRAAALEADLAERPIDGQPRQRGKREHDGVDQRLQETKRRRENANVPSCNSIVDRQRDDDCALAPTSAAHEGDAASSLDELDCLALRWMQRDIWQGHGTPGKAAGGYRCSWCPDAADDDAGGSREPLCVAADPLAEVGQSFTVAEEVAGDFQPPAIEHAGVSWSAAIDEIGRKAGADYARIRTAIFTPEAGAGASEGHRPRPLPERP